MRQDTFKVVMAIYDRYCEMLDEQGIEDSYPEIQEVEDRIKAEGFTLFELDDMNYMEDKIALWIEDI